MRVAAGPAHACNSGGAHAVAPPGGRRPLACLGSALARPTAPAAAWPPPPDPAKWIYFGGVDAGPGLAPSTDLLPQAGSIERLLLLAERLGGTCVAVTTRGAALPPGSLRPRDAWRPRRRWGEGVFIKAEAAARLGMAPQQPPSPRERGAPAAEA